MLTTTPVQRVLDVLIKTRQAKAGVPARAVWAMALGLGDGDDKLLVLALLDFHEEMNRAISALHASGMEDWDIYEPILKNGLQIVDVTRLDRTWENYAGAISEVGLAQLQICARELARRTPEKLLTEGQLKSIDDRVISLRNDVLEGGFDPNLALLIGDSLEAIHRAIAEYQIRGAFGLRRAITSGVGVLGISELRGEFNDAKKQAVRDKLRAILQDVELVTTVAVNVATIASGTPPVIPAVADAIQRLLGPG